MFRASIVHLQERSYAVCCDLVCLDTSCCYEMDDWSPKHVELLNVMNKISHQILYILLDYLYIAKWYTVHTISNNPVSREKNKNYHVWISVFLPSASVYVTRSFLFHIPDQDTNLHLKFLWDEYNKFCWDIPSSVLTLSAKASALRQSYRESCLKSTKWLI